MGNSGFKLEKLNLIGRTTPELDSFLREWSDSSDHITAYTSGSTGKPKEIRLLKRDMIRSAMSTCDYFGIGKGSRLGLPLSVNYIAGKMMVVRALISGAGLYVEAPSNRPLCGCKSEILPFTLVSVVPSQLDSILEYDTSIADNLLIGGAPLSMSRENELLANGINAFCSYGMTETCSHVAIRSVGDSIYKAMPGVTFATDNRGCLIIEAPGFSFGRLVTNDVVRQHDSVSFEWLGRYDNVINSGGIKIHPEEIETEIRRIITDREFYVTSRPSEKWGEELVLVIERPDQIDDLVAQLKGILDSVKMPKDIIYKKAFSRTSSGKIIREKLI